MGCSIDDVAAVGNFGFGSLYYRYLKKEAATGTRLSLIEPVPSYMEVLKTEIEYINQRKLSQP